jgi:hypothetical protein
MLVGMGSTSLFSLKDGKSGGTLSRDFKSCFVNPVLWKNCVYGISGGKGDPPDPKSYSLKCIDAATMQEKWNKPEFAASLIAADDKLFMITMNGELVVAKASPESYQEVARARIFDSSESGKDGIWTAPSLSKGRLYCRGYETVVCLDLRAK